MEELITVNITNSPIEITVNVIEGVKAHYDTVSELPTTLADGRIILFNGTLYRGLQDGESTLAEGTPWPVKGYKEYTGLFTQSGTDAPSVTILSNTIGNIVWTRFLQGVYRGTLSGAFTLNKTIFPFDSLVYISNGAVTEQTVTLSRSSANVIQVSSGAVVGGEFISDDNILLNYLVEVRIYF